MRELYFFFFKQKTAYEIRKGDWSSDVCSSDLEQRMERAVVHGVQLVHHGREERRVRFERGDRGAERLGADVRVVLMQGEVDELREARRRGPEDRRELAGDGHGRVACEQ